MKRFTSNSIEVKTYDNHVTDNAQKMAQKKKYSVCCIQMSSYSLLRYKNKVTFIAGFCDPRDGCFSHVAKIIF